MTRTVLQRHWPGTEGWKAPGKLVARVRFGGRLALYCHAAADLSAPGDAFGLGAVLVAQGPSILHALLLVPDDLEPAARAELEGWSAAHTVATPAGQRPWRVVSLSEHFTPWALIGRDDPDDADADPTAFYARAYVGGSPVVAYNLGRYFGLVGEHVVARTGVARDEWRIFPPGVGKRSAKSRVAWCSWHRPPLILAPRRSGWRVRFAAPRRGYGRVVSGRPWRGEFVDLAALCYTLDADRGASFPDHRRHFGLPEAELPVAVEVSPEGAAELAAAVTAVWELGLAADADAARWFTTATDRREGICRISEADSLSPAVLGDHLVRLAGIKAPLAKFDLTDEEQRAWAAAFHGGWCDFDHDLVGQVLTVASADISACFPLIAHHLGWWQLLRAKHLRREDVTDELARAAEKAAHDPAYVLDPEVLHRFGRTIAQVDPAGCTFPVAIEDQHRPDGRTEWVAQTSKAPRPYSGYTVLAAAVLSRRAPGVLSATSYEPEGRQSGLRRRLPLLPGTVLDLEEDPVVTYYARRQQAKRLAEKDANERRYKSVLHAAFNAAVSGNPSRFDAAWERGPKGWRRREVPGPLNLMPLAVSVQAGAQLLLAVLDRLVSDLGSTVAYRDTDSSFIPASWHGGEELPGGNRALSWQQVADVLRPFDRLALPGWPVWKVERGTPKEPLKMVVFGPKRHAEFFETPEGVELVDFTEANLGGEWEAPPWRRERTPDGHYAWAREVVLREVRHAVARRDDPKAWPGPVPWATEPFPAVRRLQVTTPATLYGPAPKPGRKRTGGLPASLGLRPGSYYLAVGADDFMPEGEALALDPGGDLSDWDQLTWVRREDGQPVRLAMSLEVLPGPHVFHPQRLVTQAQGWAGRPREEPIESVHVDPRNIRLVGRVSPILDAWAEGSDLRSARVTYAEPELLALVQEQARLLGPQRFAELTGVALRVAERASAGHPISAANVAKALAALRLSKPRRCALDGCDHEVTKPRAKFCQCADHADHGDLHRHRQKRAAAKARTKESERAHD